MGEQTGRPALEGPTAWLMVAVGFVATATTFAVVYSFGTFFKPMADEFHASRSATSWVYGITAFLYFGLGLITGPAVHPHGPRRVLAVGAVVMTAGLLLTSRVHRLDLGYVTYGLGVGVGVGCAYVPMIAVVGGWFDRRRSAAMGLAVAGIGMGTLVGAPISARLIRAHGWRHAYVVLAIATAVLLGLCALVSRTPPSFHAAPPLRLSSAVRSRAFASLYASNFFTAFALVATFVQLVPYAEDHGVAKIRAAMLVSVLGVGSIGGRLVLSTVAVRLGRFRVYRACFLAIALSQLIWLTASARFWQLAAYAFVVGVAYGGFVALSPAVAAEVFGAEGLGGVVGALYTSAAVGTLFGPPAGGWLIDRTGGYGPTLVLGMVLAFLGFVVLLPLERARDAFHARVPG